MRQLVSSVLANFRLLGDGPPGIPSGGAPVDFPAIQEQQRKLEALRTNAQSIVHEEAAQIGAGGGVDRLEKSLSALDLDSSLLNDTRQLIASGHLDAAVGELHPQRIADAGQFVQRGRVLDWRGNGRVGLDQARERAGIQLLLDRRTLGRGQGRQPALPRHDIAITSAAALNGLYEQIPH